MATAKAAEHKGMVWLAGGSVRMGDERFYRRSSPSSNGWWTASGSTSTR